MMKSTEGIKQSDFDLGPDARVTWWVLDRPPTPPEPWGEDLAQVEYPENMVLDVGWYRNHFRVLVVRADDWDAPLYDEACPTVEGLPDLIRRAAALARAIGPKTPVVAPPPIG